MALDSLYFGNGLVILIAVSFVICFLLFLAFKLDKEHIFLKILILFMAIYMIYLVPKIAIDYSGDCVVMVNSSTTIGSTTTYTYLSECSQNEHTTQTTFLKAVTRFFIIFSAYFVIFIFWKLFKEGYEKFINMKL